MIFPAYSSLDPDVAIEVPRTSNAAEHSHSLLHNSVGSDQDLIPGIKKLFLHVKELESQFNSIKGKPKFPYIFFASQKTHIFQIIAGHYDPAPPRSYRAPAKKIWEANDGRAPDTEAALNPRQVPVFNPLTVNKNLLLSYKWQSPNSCFVDNGLEIWFRAYCTWPTETKAAFLASVPINSFLSTLFYHFDRRFKQIFDHSADKSIKALQRNLSLMQTITLHSVFEKWKLYADKNEYGCAKTWLTHAVLV